MKNIDFSLIILSILLQVCILSNLHAQGISKNKATTVYLVDSLNESAFEIKRSDIGKALNLLNKAKGEAEKINYKKGIAINLLYSAGIYYQNGFIKKALSDFYKSYRISNEIKDTFNVARAKQQIGNAFRENGQIGEAEKLFKEAIYNYNTLNKNEEVININNYLGLMDIDQRQFASAQNYFLKALTDSRKINYKYGEKKALYNLGLLEKKRDNYQLSKKYFDSALILDVEKNDKYGMSLVKNELAEISNSELLFTESENYAKAALADARSNKAQLLIIRSIENIISSFESQKNWEKVTEWQRELIKEQKELFEKERDYAANFLEILQQQQEKQISIQQQADTAEQEARTSNIVLVIVGTALLVLSLLAYFTYNNYKKVRRFSKELEDKNAVIEANAASLNKLNLEITKQNESLSDSNGMKDKLLSIISHDLRGPLANTKGLLELVNEELLTEDEKKDLFIKLEDQYVRSLTLLDNLLFWIKNQVNGEVVRNEKIPVQKLIAEVIEENRISLESKNITTKIDVGSDIFVSGDKEMIKVVFRNLLSNSIKFTDNNTSIYFTARTRQNVEIILKDEGVGMTEEVLRKIKARKYFTTRGTKNEIGSGFGLMLCYDLIKKQDGDLVIKSEPGKGSSFIIKLHPYPAQS